MKFNLIPFLIPVLSWAGSMDQSPTPIQSPSSIRVEKGQNRLSPSYQSVVTCFPQLKNKELETKFTIEKLKEILDRTWATTQSIETKKIWTVRDAQGERKRITVTALGDGRKGDRSLTVEKLDEQDVGEILDIPSSHQKNPHQKTINIYLYKAEILEEETEKIDTKLNGFRNYTRRQRSGLIFFELVDSRQGRKVQCELKKELGPLCLCEKK